MAGSWSTPPDMRYPRYGHRMAVLPDGNIVCTGGFDEGGNPLKSVEMFEVTKQTWFCLPDMLTARRFHGMAVLSDGNIVCAGGFDEGGEPLKSVEMFEVTKQTWSLLLDMPSARAAHGMVVLPDGKIVCAGGEGAQSGTLKSVLTFNITTQTWSDLPDMPFARRYHGMVTFNGNVVCAGGFGRNVVKSVDMLDLTTQTWSSLPDMPSARSSHGMVATFGSNLSKDGTSSTTNLTMMCTGGTSSAGASDCLKSVVSYDPRTPPPAAAAFAGGDAATTPAPIKIEAELKTQNLGSANPKATLEAKLKPQSSTKIAMPADPNLQEQMDAAVTSAASARDELEGAKSIAKKLEAGVKQQRATLELPEKKAEEVASSAAAAVMSKLKATVAEVESTLLAASQMEKAKESLENVNASLSSELNEAKSKASALNKQLQQKLDEAVAAATTARADLEKEKSVSKKLRTKVEQQCANLKISEKQAEEASAEISTLQNQVATLQDKLTASEKKAEEASAEISTLQNQVAALQDKLTAADSVVTRLTRREARQWNIAADDIQVSDQDDKELGRGAFGFVLKARWNGMDVAVKKISEQATADQLKQAKKLLKNEARTLSFVRHTNVMRFYGACTEPPMLVMVAAPNGNLRQLLDSSPDLPPLERFYIARGICSGMIALHTHAILHLDLKPTNIMLDEANTPLIADFGLAVMQGGTLSVMMSSVSGASAKGGNRGTSQYKAPELYDDEVAPTYDTPADVYSYAMLVWELLTCEVPWSTKSVEQITAMHLRVTIRGDPPKRPTLRDTSKEWRSMMAPAIAALIELCWQQEPAKRPPFQEVLNLLDEHARADNLPPLPNAGQLAAAAAQKAAALERQVEQAEAERASAELAATLTTDERHALAADVERLQRARDAALEERDVNAAAMKSSRSPVKFPAEWTAQSDDGGDRSSYDWWQKGRTLVSLPKQDAKWAWAEKKLQESLPNAVLTQLELWENRLQFRDYSTKRENLEVKRGGAGAANEMWLWHGTRKLQPATALRHEVGLDPRFSRTGLYGRGLYLAEKAQYSNHGYVYCPDGYPPKETPGETSRRQVLLVRAAIGVPKVYAGADIDKDLTKPPEEVPGKLFDSVKGGPHQPKKRGPGCNDSTMYVLYDLAQAYPEYIVTYTVTV